MRGGDTFLWYYRTDAIYLKNDMWYVTYGSAMQKLFEKCLISVEKFWNLCCEKRTAVKRTKEEKEEHRRLVAM